MYQSFFEQLYINTLAHIDSPLNFFEILNSATKIDTTDIIDLRRQSLYGERFIRIKSIKAKKSSVTMTIQIYLFVLKSIPKSCIIPAKIKAKTKATTAFSTISKYFFINYPRVQVPILLFSTSYFPFFQPFKYQNNTPDH